MNLGQFSGTIDKSGYHLPASKVFVTWTHPSFPSRVMALRPSEPCNNHRDLLARYGEGDSSLNGYQTVPAFSSEASGGEVYGLLATLYERYGVSRLPTDQEFCDFGFVNFPGKLTVSVRDAQGILPDYRKEEEGEVGGSDAQVAELQAIIKKFTQDNAALAAKVTVLASRVKLAIPAEIQQTIKQFPGWKEIPIPGGPKGKYAKLKAALRWISDEAKRREA